MNPLALLVRRFVQSPVAWSWLLNGLRLGAGLILLPLLLRHLTPDELGVHYAINNLLLLLPTIDSTISFNLIRFVGYAWSGATRLHAQGMSQVSAGTQTNFKLVADLLHASRGIYGLFAIGLLAAIIAGGWAILGPHLAPLQNPRIAWLALVLTAVSAGSELYWGRWNSFLKGQNQILTSVRLQSLGYGLRLIVAAGLLVAGAGLLSVPLAGLVGGTLQRYLTRSACLRLLGGTAPVSASLGTMEVVRLLLPSAWRVGMQLTSQFLLINALAYFCISSFGLQAQARYGLSLQMFSIISALSSVWFSAHAPRLNGLRLQHDLGGLRRVLRRCLIRQALTFALLAGPAIILGAWLVEMIEPNKGLLPRTLLAGLALHAFMEIQFNTWTITAAAENQIPSAWPATISNLATILVAGGLLLSTRLELAALVTAPILTGILFNYWYWPWKISRSLGTTLLQLLAGKNATRGVAQ